MSGHSHWATIKHKKGAADAKKGKMFSKFARLVTVAAKEGGGDPEKNLKLQEAIAKARSINMPKDNIDRAIKKGTGEVEGVSFERATFEGYGPGGVAVLVDVLTDNKNRATAEIRKLFERNSGNFGSAVAWQFEKKGIIRVMGQGIKEDDVLQVALEHGADNVENIDGNFEVTCAPENFQKIKVELSTKFKLESDEVTLVPKSYVKVDDNIGKKMLNLMDALEDHDDVQGVFSNADFPDSILKE